MPATTWHRPQATCTFDADRANLASATNYQDLWWTAIERESGWGINFAHQGNSVFATWYTYNVDGTPLWLSALLKRVGASNEYPATCCARRVRDSTITGRATSWPLPKVGTATVKFVNGNSAEFDYVTEAATAARRRTAEVDRPLPVHRHGRNALSVDTAVARGRRRVDSARATER